LVFSYVGYQPQETVVSTSGVIDAALQQAFTNLEEIVVIGYGTVKKADATGSVAVVSAENFNKRSVNSPEDLLTGKAPGVVITSNSGAPGVGSTIRIRGGSSMGASNDPLIVIDGVPVQENIGGAASSLSTINPNDIESYSILKDASATAIYGSRGSNGVILITTKRGGTEFKVNYSVQSTEQTLTKEVPVMTGDQFRALGQSLPMFSGIKNNPKFFGTANTDWQKQIYHSEIEQNHNLNFSGAIAKTTPFRVSLGYTNDPGILLNTAYTRY